ncbi:MULTISPECIES: dipeptidase [Lonsdalea]|uniref:Peptidase n=2 Tax=Lonsdalea TaxID=1082702 RepID=A0ACD1JHW1_9GAMM|nr:MULTISPECIES: dipeptidase [Lonsdalea]OSM97764.1 peptidase [Lonsdalea populi]OSN01171.1 peptidase [Lonsdalea populi]QPQ24319.1 dipeptidase [Lonsdalea populi]RAT16414.1 peptidase [Lonsdalea quercina]RAT18442.1 peptidase [Lonsdalea quercina]
MSDNAFSGTECIPVFDGHNDVLSHLWRHHSDNPVRTFLQGPSQGQIDLPRLRRGGFAGGLFAIYVPSPKPEASSIPAVDALFREHAAPTMTQAREDAFAMLSLLLRIEAESAGRVRLCRSVAEIRRCMAEGALAVVMHIEGAEMLDADLHLLDVLYAAGLRSLGPLWSRNNLFGQGVPFRFPSSPDTGDGLTAAGLRLVRACNAKRILVDVSHMDEKGFWQTAEISGAPLVASHSNAHALCAQSRNLTDRQLAAIRESNGFVGVNFGTAFLRRDGRKDPHATVQEIVRHIDYLLEKAGEDNVGFGSDFDGTHVSPDLRDVAGFPILVQALAEQGYDRALMEKICYANWLRVLAATWGA